MSEAKQIKLADLIQRTYPVHVSETEFFNIKPISLTKMILLFIDEKDDFLNMYAAGLEGKTSPEDLGAFLLATPRLVAKVIAHATGEPDQYQSVQENMAGTVQLIALSEIWKVSVPDPKKFQELLSGVMARLKKESSKLKDQNPETTLPEASSQPQTSL